jgi:hypothetical protein
LKIDWSVNYWTKNFTRNNPVKVIPLVPISTAEEMKACLVKKLSAEYACVEPRLIHQAVNEAHALAALTVAPLLFLPALAEEKADEAAKWTARQCAMLDSHSIALAA